MNPIARGARKAGELLNRMPVWRGDCMVWGQRMAAKTFDRRLYLLLHRLGRLGVGERASLSRLIRPGMTVVDIGSNLGLYAILFSRLVGPTGRVLAFEPDPEIFSLLQYNCELNGCANVEALNVAVGSRHDRRILQTMAVNAGESYIAAKAGGVPENGVEVEIVSLDEIASGAPPDLVKIDVQGWELEVLKGMEGLITANPRLELYLEFWPAGLRRSICTGAELARWLFGHGFRLFGAIDMAPLDASAISKLNDGLTGLRHADVFATRDQAR